MPDMIANLARMPTRSLFWLGFFGVILLSWWYLYGVAQMSGVNLMGVPVRGNMMMGGIQLLFLMWAVMMLAMMGPTFVPTLLAYEDLITAANGTRLGAAGLTTGYIVVWLVFAATIAVLQLGLAQAGLVNDLGIATKSWIAGALLIAVGIYQFSYYKQVCHHVCHAPATYFLGHWRIGFTGGLRMGSGLGAYCVGCCWGFMALGFVGGTMSLLWMGLATVLMTLEKLPQIAVYITKPLGVALIAGGVYVSVAGTGLL